MKLKKWVRKRLEKLLWEMDEYRAYGLEDQAAVNEFREKVQDILDDMKEGNREV